MIVRLVCSKRVRQNKIVVSPNFPITVLSRCVTVLDIVLRWDSDIGQSFVGIAIRDEFRHSACHGQYLEESSQERHVSTGIIVRRIVYF